MYLLGAKDWYLAGGRERLAREGTPFYSWSRGWWGGGMWRCHSEVPPRLLPNDWRLVSVEWRVLETSYPTGMEVVVAPWVPADKGGLAAAAAGKEGDPEHSGCTSSQWPREPGPWPCTTPYPSGRAALRSTALSSSSAKTTWWGNMPKR